MSNASAQAFLSVIIIPAMAVACFGISRSSASQQEFRAQIMPRPDFELRVLSPHTVARILSSANCASTHGPEALATPNPLVQAPYRPTKITVSFIVGKDGEVESPLILEGSGVERGRDILKALRRWRYRPAMCNGVPVEAETEVQFSSR